MHPGQGSALQELFGLLVLKCPSVAGGSAPPARSHFPHPGEDRRRLRSARRSRCSPCLRQLPHSHPPRRSPSPPLLTWQLDAPGTKVRWRWERSSVLSQRAEGNQPEIVYSLQRPERHVPETGTAPAADADPPRAMFFRPPATAAIVPSAVLLPPPATDLCGEPRNAHRHRGTCIRFPHPAWRLLRCSIAELSKIEKIHKMLNHLEYQILENASDYMDNHQNIRTNYKTTQKPYNCSK